MDRMIASCPRVFLCMLLWALLAASQAARILQQGATVQEDGIAGGEAFLSEALPLTIAVTTPQDMLKAESPLVISGQQALTVVYSRSVIALGEDFGMNILPAGRVPFTLTPEIPGRFRWVTTYIARWDPDGSWPLDTEVTLNWNKNLKTHDGIVMASDEIPNAVLFKTPGLSMRISAVESDMASYLTDNVWNPYASITSEFAEVPLDGVISLRFNHNVSLAALGANLMIEQDGKVVEGLKPIVGSCEHKFDEEIPEQDDCASILIDGRLETGGKYLFVLEEGFEYSKTAGSLRSRLTEGFDGLQEFQIPLKNTTVATRFLTLDLPHGLDGSNTEETNLLNLKKQIRITEEGKEVEFKMFPVSKGTVRVEPMLLPSKTYKFELLTSDAVKDGFGLPLLSSECLIKTRPIDDRFSIFSAEHMLMYFEADQDWGQQTISLSKGKAPALQSIGSQECPGLEKGVVNIYKIDSTRDILGCLALLDQWSGSSLASSVYGSPDASAVHTTDDEFGEVQEHNLSELLDASGIVAYETCTQSVEKDFIIETDIQAVFLETDAIGSMVWLTSSSTGEPVQGATVYIYKNLQPEWKPELRNAEEYALIEEGETDAQGKYNLFTAGTENLSLVVQQNGKSIVIHNLATGYSPKGDSTMSGLILDRRLVKPGESLHISGYILQENGGEVGWRPSERREAIINIRPPLDPESNISFEQHKVFVSSEFGSFELSLPIREEAPLREYRIEIEDVWGSGEQFTVGDPRPPTVSLSVNSPEWTKPDAKIPIEVLTESFIGSSVGDAQITLNWRIDDDESETQRKNETVITTNSNGKATFEIDLGQYEVPITPGSSLKLDASWVGPTRELIEESSTVMLEVADVAIEILKTIDTDMPRRMFGVKVEVTNLLGTPLDMGDVTIELKKAPKENLNDIFYGSLDKSGSEPIDAVALDSCTLPANSANGFDCRFSLPDFGRYVLEVCIEAEDTKICKWNFFGKPFEKWEKDSPTSRHLRMELLELSSGPYAIGDTVRYAIENPYQNAKALLTLGSQKGTLHKIESLEDESLVEFSVEVDEICILNCGFSIAVSVPRQTQGLVVDTKIPVSKIFDLAMPHVTQDFETIEVIQDNGMEVDFRFANVETDGDDVVIAPGETAKIEIELDSDIVDKAEVLVVAVDKAILELLSYPLKDVSADFERGLEESFGFSTTSELLIAPQAVRVLIEDFKKRQASNPWFSPDNHANAGFGRDLDLTDEEYAQRYSRSLTGPGFGVPDGRPSSKSASSQAASKAAGPQALRVGFQDTTTPSSSVRAQKDFVSTVLFESIISEGGIARVNFTAPDSLSTFVVRAYASSGTGRFGSVEKEIIVRRAVSLTPSAPRFARVGDVFEAGAIVTVSGSNKEKATVAVSLSLSEDASTRLEVLEDAERSVKMGEDGTAEVRFKLKAMKMGNADFKITADNGQGASDALLLTVPVEGLQEAVSLASSFAVDGSGGNGWQEGLKLPEAVPGSGALSIQAGVGRLPAVLSLANQINTAFSQCSCPCSVPYDEALGLAFTPFITEAYDVTSFDMASLDNTTQGILTAILPGFHNGVDALEEMTSESLGLRFTLPCKGSVIYNPDNPSTFTNARALWIFKELEQELQSHEGLGDSPSSLTRIADAWQTALVNEVVSVADISMDDFNKSISLSAVANSRWALGGDYDFLDASAAVAADLSMERLSRELESMNVEDQAKYVLTRMAMEGGSSHPDVKKAIASWTSNFRVAGRTAYIAHSKGAAHPASNIANSMALMAMVRNKEKNPLVEKLANYIGSPPAGNYGFRVFGGYDKLVAMIALREYDVAKGSNTPDVDLKVRSGEIEVLSASFDGSVNPVASSSTPWEALDSPPSSLEFVATGKGEVTLAASLTFVPAKLLPFPTYRGLYLQRIIQVKDVESASLKTIPVTSVVTVTVHLTTPDTLGATTVRVLMPAGLEPIDPNLSGSFDSCPFTSSFGRGFFSCPTQETRPTVVMFSFRSIRAGTHTMSIEAIAATAGEFALPPVRGFVDEQPEVMGMSAAGKLVICSGDSCSAEEDAPPNLPKTCPKDCSENGACDLDSGTCLCLPGFTGNDCSATAKS